MRRYRSADSRGSSSIRKPTPVLVTTHENSRRVFHVRLIGNLIDPESLFPLEGIPTNNCYCLDKPGEESCDPQKHQSSETCTLCLLPGLSSVPAPSRRQCFCLEITVQHSWERGWVEGRELACRMVDLGTALCVFRRTLLPVETRWFHVGAAVYFGCRDPSGMSVSTGLRQQTVSAVSSESVTIDPFKTNVASPVKTRQDFLGETRQVLILVHILLTLTSLLSLLSLCFPCVYKTQQ